MTAARHAIYFVPGAETALYRAGAGLLGYDCRTGVESPPHRVADLPSDWAALTAAPRRYGFHATLKAPFRLAAGHDEAALLAALDGFAHGRAAIIVDPHVRAIGNFVALVAKAAVPALDALAADCVRGFDRFRAPLLANERARRLEASLSETERRHLETWGYPHVLDTFRFHMTLTGPLPPDRVSTIREALSRVVDAARGRDPMIVDRVVVARQDEPTSRFRVVHEAMLGPPARESFGAPTSTTRT